VWRHCDPSHAQRWRLLREILKEMDYRYVKGPSLTGVFEEWLNLNGTLGKVVEVEVPQGSISGRASAVRDDGSLEIMVEPGNHIITVTAGDVRLRQQEWLQSE